MICPKCNNAECHVIETRKAKDNSVRRRRACNSCGYRFTTYEKTETQIAVERRKLEKEIIIKAARDYYHNIAKQE